MGLRETAGHWGHKTRTQSQGKWDGEEAAYLFVP